MVGVFGTPIALLIVQLVGRGASDVSTFCKLEIIGLKKWVFKEKNLLQDISLWINP
jgi:hypothetical protein